MGGSSGYPSWRCERGAVASPRCGASWAESRAWKRRSGRRASTLRAGGGTAQVDIVSKLGERGNGQNALESENQESTPAKGGGRFTLALLQDRIQGRVAVFPVSPIKGENAELLQRLLQEHIHVRVAELSVRSLVLPVKEEIAEVVQFTPLDRIQERIVEQSANIPLPPIKEEISDVVQVTS